MAGSAGVMRYRLAFQISELALDHLFGFAGDRGCWVPAQFQSHAGEKHEFVAEACFNQHNLQIMVTEKKAARIGRRIRVAVSWP